MLGAWKIIVIHSLSKRWKSCFTAYNIIQIEDEKVNTYQLFSPLYSTFRGVYSPEIVGKENIPESGGAIIAGNHIHALDPILVGSCTKRQLHSLAKKELHDGKLGFFFRAVGTIPVDLHSKTNKEASSAALVALQQGELVGISPEAARNYTSEPLLPFKYGAVSLAYKSKCPIIPYAIYGEYGLRNKKLKIKFGLPIYITESDLTKANELLYNTILKLLLELKAE